MNHPSSVACRIAGVLYGSASVQVCQVLLGCDRSVPWNQVGVGGSATHG